MISIGSISDLDEHTMSKYKDAIQDAFPDIILCSKVIEKYWDRVERYFPSYQMFLQSEEGELLGFMNAIPLSWNHPLEELPDEGWDWMLEKGVLDYERKIVPNTLGGLQIIVLSSHLGKGYSSLLISAAKRLFYEKEFDNFIIPIRPTFKSKYPEMKMDDYIDMKLDGKIYDPWIRTHLKGGAEIISICTKAMHIRGDLPFWEKMMNKKIDRSGAYIVEGALNLVDISIENNTGVYHEDNIWISYPNEVQDIGKFRREESSITIV